MMPLVLFVSSGPIITVGFTHVLMAAAAEAWKMGSRSSLEEEDY